MMDVEEFCDRYMDSMDPTHEQRKVIEAYLDFIEHPGYSGFWKKANGAGKSTVRRAIIRHLQTVESAEVLRNQTYYRDDVEDLGS